MKPPDSSILEKVREWITYAEEDKGSDIIGLL
jgi:hypothetical protein